MIPLSSDPVILRSTDIAIGYASSIHILKLSTLTFFYDLVIISSVKPPFYPDSF